MKRSQALAILQEAAVEAMGLKQGEFKRGEAPKRDVDDELTEALKCTFPASDPVSAESTLVPGSSRGNRRSPSRAIMEADIFVRMSALS